MQTTADTSAPQTTKTSTWTIDASHSSVGFAVRHMMVTNTRGEFQKYAGTVVWDASRPEASKIEVTIDVGSIQTRDEKRDGHLKSADFFDVENHPTMKFSSRKIAPHADGLRVTGELTIRGTTREVVLEVEGPSGVHADPWGNERIGASARTKIKRSDFGMTWNAALEAGGVLVADEVKIELEVELIRQK